MRVLRTGVRLERVVEVENWDCAWFGLCCADGFCCKAGF
jgi:hypothetical protein